MSSRATTPSGNEPSIKAEPDDGDQGHGVKRKSTFSSDCEPRKPEYPQSRTSTPGLSSYYEETNAPSEGDMADSFNRSTPTYPDADEKDIPWKSVEFDDVSVPRNSPKAGSTPGWTTENATGDSPSVSTWNYTPISLKSGVDGSDVDDDTEHDEAEDEEGGD